MTEEKSGSPRPFRSGPGPRFDQRSVSLRFVLVALLILASLIPLALVRCTAGDREGYREEAVESIAHSWGREQRITGPIMFIPVDVSGRERRDEDQVEVASEQVNIRIVEESGSGRSERYVAVMPEHIDIQFKTSHEMRRRGIFEVAAFSVDVIAEGAFAPLDVKNLQDRFGELRLDLAFLGVGISDPRGIREATLVWRDGDVRLSAPAGGRPVENGLAGEVGENAVLGGEFSLALDLRGVGRFSAVPVGDSSTLTMKSSWPHPSFDGRLLPDTHDINAHGFTASWSTGHLARGFSTVMEVSSIEGDYFKDKDLGFRAFEPFDLYLGVERSTKYGILFVLLTLVSVLCLELATGLRFHFVQYGVTVGALVLFFLTLLALAEQIGFTVGYILAATLLAGMIAWYANGATGNRRLAGAALGGLLTLYAVLYAILRLESFALLVGTVVLLGALAMLMRVTRALTPAAETQAPD